MSYKSMRGYVPVRRGRFVGKPFPVQIARPCAPLYPQGDEMACACGKRWPVGESHP